MSLSFKDVQWLNSTINYDTMYFHVTNKCKSVQRWRSAADSSTIVILQTYKHVIRQSKFFFNFGIWYEERTKESRTTIKNTNPVKNLPPTMRQTFMSNQIWGIRKLITFHSERDHEFQQDWILIVSESI